MGDSGGLCGFFWGGVHRGCEEKKSRPMEFELCCLPCCVFEQTKIYVSYVLIICFGGGTLPNIIRSLYSGGFDVCDYSHVLVRCV